MFYTVTQQNEVIINALRASKGVYVDDHRKNNESDKAEFFGILQVDGEQYICPLPSKQHYGSWVSSLNPIYLKANELHLSTSGVHTLNKPGRRVVDAVKAFNAEFKDSKWGPAEIVDIVVL